MTWHKRDDDYQTNPKVVAAGEDGALVFDVLLGINSRWEREGNLTKLDMKPDALRVRLGVFKRSPKQILRALSACEAAGLIATAPDGSVRLVGWDDEWAPRNVASGFTPSPGSIRMRRYRERHRDATPSHHASQSDASHVTSQVTSQMSRDASPPRGQEIDKSTETAVPPLQGGGSSCAAPGSGAEPNRADRNGGGGLALKVGPGLSVPSPRLEKPEPQANPEIAGVADALTSAGYRRGKPQLLVVAAARRLVETEDMTADDARELARLVRVDTNDDPGALIAHWVDNQLWRGRLDEKDSKRKARESKARAASMTDEPVFGEVPSIGDLKPKEES